MPKSRSSAQKCSLSPNNAREEINTHKIACDIKNIESLQFASSMWNLGSSFDFPILFSCMYHFCADLSKNKISKYVRGDAIYVRSRETNMSINCISANPK